MKSAQIEVGGIYDAKVSGRIVPVRITGTREIVQGRNGWRNVWVGVNMQTNREITIRSPQRLRRRTVDHGHAETL